MADEFAGLGARVTLRYHGTDGVTDVIGKIVAASGPSLTVERRDGLLIDVARDAVIASRVLPRRPRRTRSAGQTSPTDLVQIASRGWPAVESQQLGEWELRASGGYTKRANSAAAVGDPKTDLAAASQRIIDFYRRRSLPPLAQVLSGSPAQRGLASLGWRALEADGAARTRTAVLATDLTATSTPDPDAQVTTVPTESWLELDQHTDPTDLAALKVLAGPPTVGFISLGSPSRGIARVAVTGEWAAVTSLYVDAGSRRQGIGRSIVESALAWAQRSGADKAYLQVAVDNTSALSLYTALGFVVHHEYDFLAPA